MAEIQKRTLWVDLAHTRYYLIPDGQELPEGELRLTTLTGRTWQVAPASVSQWIASEAAVQAHVQAAVLDFMMGTRNALLEWLPEQPSAAEGETTTPAQPADDLTMLLLGVSTGASQRDPALGSLGLHNIVKSLADLLDDVISGDEKRLSAARKRVRDFRTELEKRGVQVHPRLDALPDRLYAWYTASDDKSVFHRIEQTLQMTAARLRTAHEKGDADVQSIMADWAQGIRAALSEEETPEQRQQRYREMARASIEATGLPRFDFKKLWAEYKQQDRDTRSSS